MSEGRNSKRFDCDIMLNKQEAGVTNVARATNISLSGMRIQRVSDPSLCRQSDVKLEVRLPGLEAPIRIQASKVYETEDHVGVRFTRMSHRNFDRLRRWIREKRVVNAVENI